jgi:hypothetical protein
VPRRLRAVCLAALAGAVAPVGASAARAGAPPLSVMRYGVTVAGTQETSWSLADGVDVQGSDPACRAPIEASGHLLQTLSVAKPASLTVTTSPTPSVSGIVNLAVASERTGVDTVHWAAVNAAGGCNRAPRVDDVRSQTRCGAFAYHLPIRVSASPATLAVAGDHNWADSASGRFQGSLNDDCPWVEAASGAVLGEFGQNVDPPVLGGGLLEASGNAPDLTRLAAGPVAVPVDADTTYTATGSGEPWAGTMTVHVTLHLTLTLTPLGGEDLSIEPGRGIGGVRLGDTLDTLRRLYPHAAIVRRLDGRPGRTLWLVGVRGGGETGLQAIVGVAGAGAAKPPGSATVREVETTLASFTGSDRGYRTADGIRPGSTFASVRKALPRGRVVVWRRPSDGRSFGSWYVAGPGRVVTEFDYGQVPRTGRLVAAARGYQLRVGCPGTSRLRQYAGRPALDAC